MNRETIREWLLRRPFEIRLSNGERHEVRHPENAVLLKTRIILGHPETDRAEHCFLNHCSLIHLNSIAALPAT